jgi:hypothetical protein
MGIMTQPFFARNTGNGLLVTAPKTDNRGVEIQVEDLQPFTHFASVPADSDAASIKFESVKTMKVFTERKVTKDPGYCHELQFRDPGGSMYCPSVREETPAVAYQVTYSFTGGPLASDEYGNRRFTFQVYFRPEELPQGLKIALSAGKLDRREAATYFTLATSRQPLRASVVDEANSVFCDGSYMDGNWIQQDTKCQDKVSFKGVTTLSEYITVQVEPASPRTQQAAVSGQ